MVLYYYIKYFLISENQGNFSSALPDIIWKDGRKEEEKTIYSVVFCLLNFARLGPKT
jgi:hypothetical protein